MSFNDFTTAERLLRQYIAQTKNSPSSQATSHKSYIRDFYLELPSTIEMRKIFSVCKELQKVDNISSVTYTEDAVRVIMKKENTTDESEIPKKYDVKNYYQIDKMRNKFKMKNAHLPSKQVFGRDYWIKKREESAQASQVSNSMRSKRRHDNSMDVSNSENDQQDKKKKIENTAPHEIEFGESSHESQ